MSGFPFMFRWYRRSTCLGDQTEYNYYCDTPYPLLRKEVMVYADYACTQFLTKRVYEDRVPV